MPEVIGVKFRNVGKVYYFDPVDYEVRYHDHVIVETARGIEYGTVVLTRIEVPEEKVTQPLKQVIRMATAEDTERETSNRVKEKEAYKICKQKIAEHGLDMKLIEAEYTFDDSKVLFYFTAEGRIDFRELVKDLAGIFRTRIELRQIGVRDETKLLGGMGSCGRPLCCHTWLGEFAPVSIKMAKDQNLSLNPTKISGTCGRLMCCLKNEADMYAQLNKGLPNKGDYVTTPDGKHGDVVSVNILRQTVKVIVELENDEKELQEFSVGDITFIPKSKKPKMQQNAGKEMPKEAAKDARRNRRGGKDEEVEIPDFIEKAELRLMTEETPEGEGGNKKRRRRQKDKEPAAANAANPESAEEKDDGAHSEHHEGSRRNRSRKPKNKQGGNAEHVKEHAPRHTPEAGEAGGHPEHEGADGEHKARRRRRRPHKGPRPEGEGGRQDSAPEA